MTTPSKPSRIGCVSVLPRIESRCGMSLTIAPIGLRCRAYVTDLHPPSRTHAWAQVLHRLPRDDRLCGVAVGTPLSHEPSMTATLKSCAFCTDGTPNACSKLYGAVRRAAREIRILPSPLPKGSITRRPDGP